MLTSKPCRGPVGDPKTRDMSFGLPSIVVALIGVYSYLVHVSIRLPPALTWCSSLRLDPAIIGTTGLLKAVKKNAPSVKRVIITSSFAAIVDPTKGSYPGYTYVPIPSFRRQTNPSNETPHLTFLLAIPKRIGTQYPSKKQSRTPATATAPAKPSPKRHPGISSRRKTRTSTSPR